MGSGVRPLPREAPPTGVEGLLVGMPPACGLGEPATSAAGGLAGGPLAGLRGGLDVTLLDLFTACGGGCGPGGEERSGAAYDGREVSTALKLRDILFFTGTTARGLLVFVPGAACPPRLRLRAAAVEGAARSDAEGLANTTTGTLVPGRVGERDPALLPTCCRGRAGVAAAAAGGASSSPSGRPSFLLITAIRLALNSS